MLQVDVACFADNLAINLSCGQEGTMVGMMPPFSLVSL